MTNVRCYMLVTHILVNPRGGSRGSVWGRRILTSSSTSLPSHSLSYPLLLPYPFVPFFPYPFLSPKWGGEVFLLMLLVSFSAFLDEENRFRVIGFLV